ncbi:MAG TPA: protein kinase, partial [Polyangiales bacterium]
RVGELKIVKKLGEGGLSVVYLAEADGGGQAALKVIRPEYSKDRAAVHRFTTASRAMQTVRAPGLAPILGVGQLADARPWVAAEFVKGSALAEKLKQNGPLHINDARPVFAGVLQGLIALHRRGLVHGDIKAENVFLVSRAADGGNLELSGVLVDAGAERLLSRSESKVDATTVLPLIGTAKAMSPEQARGLEPDVRSDIYGMGTLIYETLTGRPPFLGDCAIDVIAQQVSAVPEPPSHFARRSWVSEALDDLVLRALAKDPHDRFPDAASMLEALDHIASRPSRRRPLDEVAFTQARNVLLSNPSHEPAADSVENQARDSGSWDRAATVFAEAARAARDELTQLSLLFRAARIYETELKDPLRSEAIYQQILSLDESNAIALRGVEAARRASGDYPGLLEILLDRLDREQSPSARSALLHEMATLYEEKLLDEGHALIAWVQALVQEPQDARALRAIERLTSSHEARMSEALETLAAAAEEQRAELFGDEQAARAEAASKLDQVKAELAAAQAKIAEQAEQRVQADERDRDARTRETTDLQAALQQVQGELTTSEAKREVNLQRVRETEESLQDKRSAHESLATRAEEAVERFESAEMAYGPMPTLEQQEELNTLAQAAESLVDEASALEAEVTGLAEELAMLETDLGESDDQVAQVRARVSAADDELAAIRGSELELLDDDDASTALTLDDEEAAEIAALEERVADAERECTRFAGDESERAAARKQQLADLVQLYVIMGRFYASRVGRPDVALTCYQQALDVDPDNDTAFDAVLELYRASQAYQESVTALLARADRAYNPVRARDWRAQAAVILANKLGDESKARAQLERVLADDPAHQLAQDTLASILTAREEYGALGELLERRVSALFGDAKLETRLALAQLYEDRLNDPDRAESHYVAVAEAAPRKLDAFKGLERIYASKENYEGLLNALRSQIDLAPTPRQRIALFERIGLLLEKEFVNYEEAAEAFEQIVAIDPSHEAANIALVRLYRHLSRFEEVVDTLQRLANVTSDPMGKIELLLQAVRTFNVDIGSPERAMILCERILDIDPEEPEALTELARLKSTAGDVASALIAIERLAEHEQEPHKQAEQYIRAGKLLEESGDRD